MAETGLGIRRFSRWPRRTVRLRLTLLYAGLFLVCGIALLATTYLIQQTTSFGFSSEGGAAGSSSSSANGSTPACPGPSGGATGPGCHDFAYQVHAAEAAQLPVVAAISLGGAALLSAGLGWIVAGRTLRPLRTMTATTRQISADNLHRRLAMAGPDDELKDLGDTIDGLLERLEGAFDAQRSFVANASHELRTPLAMMRTSLEVAMAKTEPISPQLRALAPKLQDGLDRAETLLEGLLVLARAQHGVRSDVAEVSLAELVRAALQG
ncbi:MAG: HAMP domain-containing protein, partial [Candidatus Dormibacteraeota bacterium]|nr:HAMP domain-containing protein [Candidatus Dormibacteraeota bacterium]